MSDLTFIESQFPVSKLSKESYKERKANYSQTLTGLGKWWGRKPLVLVRAVILGLLLPATPDPKRDREIFLKLMTMDADSLWRRKSKSPKVGVLYAFANKSERITLFTETSTEARASFRRNMEGETLAAREALERRWFETLSYDAQLEYCDRPEQIDGPDAAAWVEVNAYLGTQARSLPELVHALGLRRFGHAPRVGDAFCGGGSVPFEAARLGCETYASDLNPVAALLTWGALNIVGGGEDVAYAVAQAQQAVYNTVDAQITKWGIEHNEEGWRADAYLYCAEATCPDCGWRVPLAPSWVIGEKTHTVAQLVPDAANKRFEIVIKSAANADEMHTAKTGTAQEGDLLCPHCGARTPMGTLRGDRRDLANGGNGFGNSLRLWENADLLPRPHDVFGERLYCVRWIETKHDGEREIEVKHYRSVNEADLQREATALHLLRERLADWQAKGFLPSARIEPGEKTTEPIRTRGWTHWHHLFNPRQLLIHGEMARQVSLFEGSKVEKGGLLLSIGKMADWDSKLTKWTPAPGSEKTEQTFVNQALNTLANYGHRGLISLERNIAIFNRAYETRGHQYFVTSDARTIKSSADLWITDPPYADAVNYHELTEYFLAWYEKSIQHLFPDWYADSKRALAVQGKENDFRLAMVECYRNLAQHMPDEGMQVVMFTHQDASVWADLALILWAAGLRVTAAWTIATETDSALRTGNYVQGTVLLVLRKRVGDAVGFLDDINADIKPEVEQQLAGMLALDDQENPNFGDSDYQLAAYAAALRVMTQFGRIEELDIERELTRPRVRGEKSVIQQAIENAVQIASHFLIPLTLHADPNTRTDVWRNLTSEERFYVKGLDVESHGELRQGVYQEFARGFGLRDYISLLGSTAANEARLKTASEFKGAVLGGAGFGGSLLRHCLFAVFKTREDENAESGKAWLRHEIAVAGRGDYWAQRQTILVLLDYFAKLPTTQMPHWKEDAYWAQVLAGVVRNDRV
jgi:adenine-specific DNA methylase